MQTKVKMYHNLKYMCRVLQISVKILLGITLWRFCPESHRLKQSESTIGSHTLFVQHNRTVSLFCIVVMGTKKRYPPLLLLLPLAGAGLTLLFTSCSTWESGACISSWQQRGADPVDRDMGELVESMSRGELVPPFIFHMAAWVGEKRCPIAYPLLSVASERTVPEFIRAREVPLTLDSCSTWEYRPCTLPGQYSRDEPAGRISSEPVPKLWVGESWLYHSSVVQQHNKGKERCPSPSVTLYPSPTAQTQKLTLPLSAVTFRKVGPALCLSSTAEVIL